MTTTKVECPSPITSPLSSPPPLSPGSLHPSIPVKNEPSSIAAPGESQRPSQTWSAIKATATSKATIAKPTTAPRPSASTAVQLKAPIAASNLAPPFQPFFPQHAAKFQKIKEQAASAAASTSSSTLSASKTAQAASRGSATSTSTAATIPTSPKAATLPSPAGCPCSAAAAQQCPPAPLASSQYVTHHSYGHGWSAAPRPPPMQHSLPPPPGLPAATQHYAGPSMSSSHPGYHYHHQPPSVQPSWPTQPSNSAWQPSSCAHCAYAASTAPIRAELEAARWNQGVTWAELDRFFRDRRERNYCADIFAGNVRPLPVDLEILGLRLGIDRQRLYDAFQPYGMPSALRHR